MEKQHVETVVWKTTMQTGGIQCAMGFVSHKICLAMEYVKMENFYVERCVDKMMEIGELVMEDVSIRQRLAMECVQWKAIFVGTVLGALLLMKSPSKSAMEIASSFSPLVIIFAQMEPFLVELNVFQTNLVDCTKSVMDNAYTTKSLALENVLIGCYSVRIGELHVNMTMI